MRIATGLAALAALALVGTAARAEDPKAATKQDLRCLVVAYTLSANPDPQTKSFATAALIYFLGRLNGREPDMDVEARVRAEIPKIAPADFMTDLQECGALVKKRGEEIKTIGEHLRDHPAN